MRFIIISLFCLITYSCSVDTESTYSKSTETTIKSSSVTDIIFGETLEDWSLRVIAVLEEENVDVLEYWLDDSEKQPSTCGCWSCSVSGYQLKVITTVGKESMRALGFE